MKQRGQTEVRQRHLGVAGAIRQGDGQQGDVDRVIVSVLVMASQSSQTQQGRFILHHQVDDVLNRALGLFEIHRAAVPHGLHEPSHRGGGLGIGVFGLDLVLDFRVQRRVSGLSGIGARVRVFMKFQFAGIFQLNAVDFASFQFLPEIVHGFCGGIQAHEEVGKFAEIFGGYGGRKRESSDFPFIERIDDAADHCHLLCVDFEVAFPEEEKVVLQAQRHGLIVGQRLDQGEHRLHRLIQRGIRPAMNLRGLDERIELGDELEAQHDELLIENISGFGPLPDFLRQGFLVCQQRLRLFVFCCGLNELEFTHGASSGCLR